MHRATPWCRPYRRTWFAERSQRCACCKLRGLCAELDEKQLRWDNRGLLMAEKELLIESNTLFDDMIKKLDDFPDLSRNLQAMLYEGESFTFNPDNRIFNLARMFGYVRPNENGKAVISNRIFETRLYNYFSSLEEISKSINRDLLIKAGSSRMAKSIWNI
ncbi:MAG: hypothetical protein IJM59_06420 [Proteobacteria bacterium]|nr:hypothetical protein [Pseudomonadota bacterium]